MSFRRLLCLSVIVLSLAACERSGDAPAPNTMTMRVYDVSPDRATALRDSLNEALNSANDGNGRVSVGAAGKLVVLAPEHLHPSIEASLVQLKNQVESPAVESSLRLSLWTIDALPGDGESSPGLDALKPALDALREQSGAARFILRDRIESVSVSGQTAKRTWGVQTARGANVTQALAYEITRAGEDAARLYLHLDDRLLAFDPSANEPPERGLITNTPARGTSMVETTALVGKGQLLVLASQPMVDARTGEALSRYYIVRVDAVGAD